MKHYKPKNQLLKQFVDFYDSLYVEYSDLDYQRILKDNTTTKGHKYKLSEMTRDFDDLSKADFLEKYDDTYSYYYDEENKTMRELYEYLSKVKESREKLIQALEKFEKIITDIIKGGYKR